jgi:hypothetical protein
MANLSLSRIGLLPLAVILALAGCDQAPRPAPAPAPAPPPEVVAPPPAPEPTPEARFQLMTTQLRGQLASERARRQAIVEDNSLSLYRQIREGLRAAGHAGRGLGLDHQGLRGRKRRG